MNATVLKTVIPARVSGVRIPPSPYYFDFVLLAAQDCSKENLTKSSMHKMTKKRSKLIAKLWLVASVGLLLIAICLFGISKKSSSAQALISLPKGYTLDKYKVEEVLDISCRSNNQCSTPTSYLIQSRCPFVSLCLKGKCAVVCPQHEK